VIANRGEVAHIDLELRKRLSKLVARLYPPPWPPQPRRADRGSYLRPEKGAVGFSPAPEGMPEHA